MKTIEEIVGRGHDKRNLGPLTHELGKLGFGGDFSGKWISHDGFSGTGITGLETMPARVRVSTDGRRLELGAAIVDLEGMLALAKILYSTTRDLDAVRDFWPKGSRYTFSEEGGRLYVGSKITPTPLAFEHEINNTRSALDLPLVAAVKGLSYEEMKAAESGHYDRFKIEAGIPQSRSYIFSTLPQEMAMDGVFSGPEKTERIIPADNLRRFPLDSKETFIHFAPGTLNENGKTREFKSVDVIAYNGQNSVDINISDEGYNWDTKEYKVKGFWLRLPIPEGKKINVVDDLDFLRIAEVLGPGHKKIRNADITIFVHDNSFKVRADDGSFELEIRTPACQNQDCKLPTWKFPWPEQSQDDKLLNSKNVGKVPFSSNIVQVDTSLGIYRCLVGNGEEQKMYCKDCANEIHSDYYHEHPFASGRRANEVVVRRLQESGNQM